MRKQVHKKSWRFVTYLALGIAALSCGDSKLFSEGIYHPTPPRTCTKEPLCNPQDTFLEGYVQALVDRECIEFEIDAVVKHGCVYLSYVPYDCRLRDRLRLAIRDIPGINQIYFINCPPRECPPVKAIKDLQCRSCYHEGTWLPQSGPLFDPLLADPRQVSFSVAYRMGSEYNTTKNLGAVTFGDEFAIYRWKDVWWNYGGLFQVGIESGIFAVFDLPTPSMNLVNADYYLGIPLTYVYGRWSYRFRIYHISSHLGDEFLLGNPDLVRVNPSFEATDLFASYYVNPNLRFFLGVGYYIASDASYPFDKWYVGYGFEAKFLAGKSCYYRLYWAPYLATYFQNRQFQNWHIDATYEAGIEVGKTDSWRGTKARLALQLHDGFCLEGQLQLYRARFTAFRLSYFY